MAWNIIFMWLEFKEVMGYDCFFGSCGQYLVMQVDNVLGRDFEVQLYLVVFRFYRKYNVFVLSDYVDGCIR